MKTLVETRDLSKDFGSTKAVDSVSFRLEEGEVMGFIGPNGAGKSTTLKMLATVLKPSSGTALIDGYSVRDDKQRVRRLIGYMPDVCGLYEEMLVHEYLRFFCSVYGKRGKAAEKSIDDVLGLTGLESKINETCMSLSRGMSQRLHLARVLLHDPKLLLLDEPASGLDPHARLEFRDLVATLKGLGKTLIISSHILSELGEMCDTITVIEQSKLVYSGTLESANDQVRSEGRVFELRARVEAEHSAADLLEISRGFPFVDAVREGDEPGSVHVRFKPDYEDFFNLNAELVKRGFKIESFSEEELRLEEAFMHLTRGRVK